MIGWLSTVVDYCAVAVLLVAASILLLEISILAGIVLPSASAVLLIGSMIGAGELNLGLSAVVLIAASTAGAQFAFARNRRSGRRRHRSSYRLFGRVDAVRGRAQRLFSNDVHIGTVLSHLVAGARTIGPRMAAASPLSYRRFAVLNAVAATIWVSTWLGVGIVAGANPDVGPWAIGFVVVLVVAVGLFRAAKRRVSIRSVRTGCNRVEQNC
ncbi:membrane-associated protein [Rhodococcus rhodochrous J45]|uniref:Membrane-associated protein n=1 Tax=Rhodococcus rhodochrous J45 TaxID=935266 RepID=A0A562E2C5_RHORH|nr:VTT domain-containing protein [Rhodococcus rhodochrous]TWH16086.1 membrane-associated protein [Rhodococcus rhodochrous J45]